MVQFSTVYIHGTSRRVAKLIRNKITAKTRVSVFILIECLRTTIYQTEKNTKAASKKNFGSILKSFQAWQSGESTIFPYLLSGSSRTVGRLLCVSFPIRVLFYCDKSRPFVLGFSVQFHELESDCKLRLEQPSLSLYRV